MKTKVYDIFTGEEEIDIGFDKFVSKRLQRIDDKVVVLERGKPEPGEAILVLDRGELVNAVYIAVGTSGVYWFPDWKCYRSVYKTDGWCRLSQFA